MDGRGLLDRKIHPTSVWTFREMLGLYRAFMEEGMRLRAARRQAAGHPDKHLRAAIQRARGLASDVLGPGHYDKLWRTHAAELMAGWFDVCLRWDCIPVQPIPFQMRANVDRDFRKCIDEMELLGFPVPSSSYVNDMLTRAEHVCLAHLRVHPAPANPPPTRLSAQEFIEGMLDMPRGEREAFAARLLARP